MKTILLTIGIAVISFSATAQNINNPGGFFLKGGFNFASLTSSETTNIQDATATSGFHFGVVSDIPIANSLFTFQPGVFITSKGAYTTAHTIEDKTINPGATMQTYRADVRPLYLEVPLNLVVKIPVSNRARLFIGAGPYAAMGIGGKVSGTRSTNGAVESYDRKIIFKDASPYDVRSEDNNVYKLNRFDVGINALAGIEVGRLLIGANYGYGFSNVNAYHENDYDSNKNRVVSISLGYNLAGGW